MGPAGLLGRSLGSRIAPPQTHRAWDTWTQATAAGRGEGPGTMALGAFSGAFARDRHAKRGGGSWTVPLPTTGRVFQLRLPFPRRSCLSCTCLGTGTRDSSVNSQRESQPPGRPRKTEHARNAPGVQSWERLEAARYITAPAFQMN